jgi:hypothetical protein
MRFAPKILLVLGCVAMSGCCARLRAGKVVTRPADLAYTLDSSVSGGCSVAQTYPGATVVFDGAYGRMEIDADHSSFSNNDGFRVTFEHVSGKRLLGYDVSNSPGLVYRASGNGSPVSVTFVKPVAGASGYWELEPEKPRCTLNITIRRT